MVMGLGPAAAAAGAASEAGGARARALSEVRDRCVDVAVGYERRDIGQAGYSVRAGTAAELAALGPAPPCAGCTLAATDRGPTLPRASGVFFQQGWTTFCPSHKALARSEEPRPALPVPPSATPALDGQDLADGANARVTSISARWREQTALRKQRMKRKRPPETKRQSTKQADRIGVGRLGGDAPD